jgi:ferredoxin
MPQIVFLPHAKLCPEGAVIEAPAGKTMCDVMLENDIDIEHACEKSCACTTCHVLVREGFESLNEATEPKKTCWTRPGAWKPCRACPARPWWPRKTWSSKFRSTPSTTQRRRSLT